jgi:mono/diheme cytochrome c family protein
MTRIDWGTVVMGGLLTVVATPPLAPRQTTGPPVPSLVISSMAGQDLFRAYCASCHGAQGRGDGPTAPALKSAAPDLTTIAKRMGGAFPAERVMAIVTHGEALASPAHGSSDMPVWGPLFRALDPNEPRARARISAIVGYVESLQGR